VRNRILDFDANRDGRESTCLYDSGDRWLERRAGEASDATEDE
jgi:hypothetical protein